MSAEIRNLESLKRKLQQLGAQMPHAVGAAMYAEMQVEREESMRRTPVHYGILRASHNVVGPDFSGNDITVRIEVGGPAAPYALYVHENLEALHRVGQAKFLESTILESKPHMARRIATRLGFGRLVTGR